MSRWGPLRSNVIDLFTSRPFARQWSLIPLSHRGPLRNNGHWFLSFRYRHSPRDWSNMFFKKLEKKIIKQSDLSDCDPLHGNGHRIWIFWIDPLHGIGLIWFFQKVKKRIKRIGVSNRDSLLGNSYLVLFFRYRPSPLEWSSLSSNLSSFETRTNLVFLSLLIIYYDNMKRLNFHIIY